MAGSLEEKDPAVAAKTGRGGGVGGGQSVFRESEAMKGEPVLALPLEETLFFPVSGNPIGFNHFAAAEWLLHGRPAWKRIVFVLSNGIHPDPTKPDAEAGREQRLELLTTAIAELGDPERSHLAAAAQREGETLHATPETLRVWSHEFAFSHAVRTAETIEALRLAHRNSETRINWFAGSDLIARMAEPAIFGDDDLALLARHCHYAILEREGHPLHSALERLAAERGVTLDHERFKAEALPGWLARFLPLSSTRIRHAAEAGDPLGAMLTQGAAALLSTNRLYSGTGAHSVTSGGAAGTGAGAVTGTGEHFSAWRRELERLRKRLEQLAAGLSERFTRNKTEGKPHSLSLVEATVGGVLTHAFAGRGGASVFFRQARFAYDLRSKEEVVGGALAGRSAVSEEFAVALAQGMRERAESDFALAETGMAGPPDGKRRSFKNGFCHVAFATPKRVHTSEIRLNPFQTRKEHQLLFSIHALERVEEWLSMDGY